MQKETGDSAPSTDPKKESAKKLGSWLNSKVGAIGEHVKEMRDNTKLIVTDVTESVQKDLDKAKKAGQKLQTKMQSGLGNIGRHEERIQVTFEDGPLGLELDLKNGAVVMKIIPDGQADKLRVQVTDRLVAIGPEPLPPVEDNEKLKEAVKTRMKLPRPIVFTFVRPSTAKTESTPAESSSEATAQASAQDLIRRAEAAADEAQRDAEDARREAHTAREEVLALRADLELSKAWGSQEVRKAQAEAEEVRTEAAQRVAAGEALVAAATTELDEMREKYQRLEEEVAASQKRAADSARLEQELERIQSTNAEVLQRAESAELSLTQVRQELDDLRTSLAEEKELLAASEATVHQLNRDVEASRIARAEDAKRLEIAESSLGRLREEADALRSSGSDSAKQMEVNEMALSQVRNEADKLRVELAEESERCKLAQASIAEGRQESDRLHDEMLVLKSSLDQKDTLYQERVQEVQRLLSAQAEITQRATTAETSLENFQAEFSATKASLEAASEAERTKAETDLASSREEILSLKSTLEQKENQLQAKMNEADTLRAACAAATANESEREGEASASAKAASAAMAAAQEETSSLREEVVRWKTSCEEVRSKADADASAFRGEISNLKSSLHTKEALVTETGRSAEVARGQAAAAQEELEKAQAEKVALHNELDSLRMTDAEQLKRLEATKASLNHIREEATTLRSGCTEDAQKIASLEEQISTHAKAALAAESESKSLRDEVRSAHAELDRLRQGEPADDAQTRTVSAEASLSKLMGEIDGMRAAHAEDVTRANVAEALVKELREEVEKLREKSGDIEGLRAALAEAVRRADVAEALVKELRVEAENLREESLQRLMAPTLSESSPVNNEQEVGVRTRSQYEAVITELRATLARDIRRADAAEARQSEEVRRAELAERLASDLRRDVQRLTADWDEERRKNVDAEEMLDRLRAEIARLKSGSGAGDRVEIQKQSTPTPSPGIIGMSAGSENDESEMLALLSDFDGSVNFDSSEASKQIRAAKAKIVKLEAENQSLQKRIDARPIVYQYGPDPEDDFENEDEADMEVGELQEATEGNVVKVDNAEIPIAVNRGAVIAKKCSACRKKCARCLWKCRQQRAAKNIERLMRGFTKMLLRYPILLWFFYIQLIVLWSLELYRQAMSKPIAGIDPAAGLEKALSRGGVNAGR